MARLARKRDEIKHMFAFVLDIEQVFAILAS